MNYEKVKKLLDPYIMDITKKIELWSGKEESPINIYAEGLINAYKLTLLALNSFLLDVKLEDKKETIESIAEEIEEDIKRLQKEQ